MKCRLASLLGLAAALLVIAGSPPARADLHVIESTVPTIKVGSQLADRDSLRIPAGAQIRVVLPSGKTQTVKGPFTGTVAELAKGQPRNEGVLAWLQDVLKTGGATEVTPGATRSIGRVAPRPMGFSWSAVPVTMDGNVCIEKGAKVQLVRAPSSPEERVAVIDAASSQRGEAQWDVSSDTAAWPANLVPRPDGTYLVVVGDKPPRRITLRVLATLPTEDDVLTKLHELGCKQQFEAWVRERAATTR
jgi:hypothetical protein